MPPQPTLPEAEWNDSFSLSVTPLSIESSALCREAYLPDVPFLLEK